MQRLHRKHVSRRSLALTLSRLQKKDDEGTDDLTKNLFEKNLAEAREKMEKQRKQSSFKDDGAKYRDISNLQDPLSASDIAISPEAHLKHLPPTDPDKQRLRHSSDLHMPPGKTKVLQNYKGTGQRNPMEVSFVEGMNIPFLMDGSPNTGLRGKRENKKLLQKHKTMSDPIWHLTGGRHAIDTDNFGDTKDWHDDDRVRYGLLIGPIFFFVLIKLVWQTWWRPDEEGVFNTVVSEGTLKFDLENEIATLRNSDGYGTPLLKSVTYRKILKSECLKKYGMPQGKVIFEETIYDCTGSYDLAHECDIEGRPGFFDKIFS